MIDDAKYESLLEESVRNVPLNRYVDAMNQQIAKENPVDKGKDDNLDFYSPPFADDIFSVSKKADAGDSLLDRNSENISDTIDRIITKKGERLERECRDEEDEHGKKEDKDDYREESFIDDLNLTEEESCVLQKLIHEMDELETELQDSDDEEDESSMGRNFPDLEDEDETFFNSL